MKMILSLIAVLMIAGCSSGPVLKKNCDAIGNRDSQYSCSGDSVSKGCVYQSEKGVFVCDK